jgi:Spy/CpxP family protein refolding chaperone
MKASRFVAVAGALVFAISCDRHPTAPNDLQASLDVVDPVVVTFSATMGLPGGPVGDATLPPFMGGMSFADAPPPPRDGKGPGAPLPDSLKLTAAQKTQIQALVMAFAVANAADLATMKAAHEAARAAHAAGKSKADLQAILDGAKAAADRVRAAAAALQTAIHNVLTPAQQAWLAAHKPDHPPRTP